MCISTFRVHIHIYSRNQEEISNFIPTLLHFVTKSLHVKESSVVESVIVSSAYKRIKKNSMKIVNLETVSPLYLVFSSEKSLENNIIKEKNVKGLFIVDFFYTSGKTICLLIGKKKIVRLYVFFLVKEYMKPLFNKLNYN